MAGIKNPINILHRLGHSISYDILCRRERAQAVLSQELLRHREYAPTGTRSHRWTG